MLPNPYIIKSEKHSNGIWEAPEELKYMNSFNTYSADQYLLISAILVAVAEYTKRFFEVQFVYKKGFTIIFQDNLIPQMFIVNLDRYKLEGNKLEGNKLELIKEVESVQ